MLHPIPRALQTTLLDAVTPEIGGAVRLSSDLTVICILCTLQLRLADLRNLLPSSLTVEGVTFDSNTNPHFCGTFADIYQASYHRQSVALKRIRVFKCGDHMMTVRDVRIPSSSLPKLK